MEVSLLLHFLFKDYRMTRISCCRLFSPFLFARRLSFSFLRSFQNCVSERSCQIRRYKSFYIVLDVYEVLCTCSHVIWSKSKCQGSSEYLVKWREYIGLTEGLVIFEESMMLVTNLKMTEHLVIRCSYNKNTCYSCDLDKDFWEF